jgi:hypothetical protein
MPETVKSPVDEIFGELQRSRENARPLARSRPGGSSATTLNAGTGTSRRALAAYLGHFPHELQETALIDLLEVVTLELLARQRPSRTGSASHDANDPAPTPRASCIP